MFVYKLTLPDETVYIGSCKDLGKRLREHKSKAKTDSTFQVICSAISRFGFENTKIEVLAILETRALAYKFEENAIRIARQAGSTLLNADLSKRKPNQKREVDRMRMSRIAKQAWANPETRENLKRAAKRRALANSEEMKMRQKKSTLARIENSPLVKVYSNAGQFLFESKSTKALSGFFGIRQTSVCKYIRDGRSSKKYRIEVLP